jgi:hypothetical protein
VIISLRILIKVEFSKTLMNPRVVHSQNKHNNENQRKYLGKEICEYYYLDLHKRLINSRHDITFLA